jgi:sedoheptulose-bisphosphatase
MAMFNACKEIAYKIRTASCDKMACFNEFGDEQLAIDILANNVLFQNLRDSGVVATASSEETPTEDPMGGEGYSVAFDPLDGSSIIDTNFAVGTIFGIWPGSRYVLARPSLQNGLPPFSTSVNSRRHRDTLALATSPHLFMRCGPDG